MIDPLVRAVSGDDVPSPEPLPPGVAVRAGRLIPALGGLFSGMLGPAAAVTLGRTIVVHPRVRLTPRLLRHELTHVRQWEAHPFTFPVRYVWNHLRYGYDANPFEAEARRAELDEGP